jgi:hypothetical protein
MKFYRVSRTDKVDYEEFIEAVVRAESSVDALVLVSDKYGVRSDFSNVRVDEVLIDGPREVLVESSRGA